MAESLAPPADPRRMTRRDTGAHADWGRTHVYRLYDESDRLLYVGVSGNLVERLRKHAQRPPFGKAWWPEVAYCAIEAFPSMTTALAAEVQAIRTEAPAYNVRSAVRVA